MTVCVEVTRLLKLARRYTIYIEVQSSRDACSIGDQTHHAVDKKRYHTCSSCSQQLIQRPQFLWHCHRQCCMLT